MKSSGKHEKVTSQSNDQTNKNDSMGHQKHTILQLQSKVGNYAVLQLLRKQEVAKTPNHPVRQMMKILQVDGQFRDVEAGEDEKAVYDLDDLGDIQKLIEYFQMQGGGRPPLLQDAIDRMIIRYPAKKDEEYDNDFRMEEEGGLPPMVMPTSTDEQRETLAKTISTLSDSYTFENYKELIPRDLLLLRPYLVPQFGPMWDDNDPILQVLSGGFGQILDAVKASKNVFLLFTKVGDLQIKGVFGKGRTLLDYLNDARVSCAQSIDGEMSEWFEIIKKDV